MDNIQDIIMNRIIKFRAWDIRNKQMIHWNEILRSKELLQSMFSNEHYITNPPRYFWSLMQFIGLYDCEGKEIYEGDIVELFDGSIYKGVVKFGTYNHKNQGGYDWVVAHGFYIDNQGCIFEDNGWNNSIKVIGNIFEHEQLLD